MNLKFNISSLEAYPLGAQHNFFSFWKDKERTTVYPKYISQNLGYTVVVIWETAWNEKGAMTTTTKISKKLLKSYNYTRIKRTYHFQSALHEDEADAVWAVWNLDKALWFPRTPTRLEYKQTGGILTSSRKALTTWWHRKLKATENWGKNTRLLI